jgi:acyl-coenzyme A synthetase/AMP-(fatty) acid ligase
MKKNILEFFYNTVEKNQSKIAAIEFDKTITFCDLDKRAQILANAILAKKSISNMPIAVYLPKSIDSVVADIAITYSCNIYMNIDVKSPHERIKNIFDLIKPEIVITNSANLKFLNGSIENNKILLIDEVNFNQESDRSLLLSRIELQIDTDPLCIINTSGSTGTPKGVVLNHRSFIEFTEVSIEIFKFSNQEIIGSLSPLVFDIYSFELCLLMSKGSTLLLIPDHLAAFPIKILELLKLHQVTFIFWVPTIMVNIANMNLLEAIQLPDLKIIWFAGEVFPTKQFNYWKRMLSHTMFANLYGPIEITLDCTYFIVNREIADEEQLPIGIPYRNTDILILNDKDELIKEDEEGELCVRGTSLAMGYYNNPEKTHAAFVQNPLNKSYPEIIYRTGDVVAKNSFGEIVFKGRKDSLVKHLGYRIELGEIEHVIVNTLKIAKNGCVLYQTTRKEIILFYESNTEISPAEFRKQIAEILPKYMIPTIYIRMDELPRNTNGKIDRLMLKNQIN